ncbi:TRAP-type C4-dicarboxylate transport system, substrate-binding protein [Tistlia consotensis]|uniref:TRAP-type C4-dicarboxylate transport system, substrate-binding protein n=1 Tax=Tistlia consotensis USBA 355 TaxID=560819 RepID=A0A1Y6CIU7_9PROT|nr:TRAP transporter substrate-binding protein [Tistlia consotensis]SMF64749.1 TRAP-type C4-dicarboxylate transport system, substrate-binding protein [Tistlia consotensis USBA 355]SNR96753.1 TRAP-type C4-dicarboxylate transport system, substrate-binding protein [Tistlia consotensis]
MIETSHRSLRGGLLGLGAGLLLAAGLGVAAGPAAAETWDMPEAYSATNYHSENNAAFAAAVTKATGGKLEIKTHPGGSLIGGGEIYSSVRRGIAPIGERLMSALGNENPLFEIDAIPFVATSFADAMKLYKASKPEIVKIMDEQGLVFLFAVPWPPQGLYTNKPVTKIEDMKGVKFRAYNAATSRLAELMGAIPTKIETAELSQAFATGVAESMISSGSTGYDRQLWEYVKYWYDTQAWLPKNMVFANKDAWNGLDEATRKIIRDEAAKAEKAGWAKAEELSDWYKTELAKHGMEVGPPSAELAAGFKTVGATMAKEWKEKAGEAGQKVLDAYSKM